MSKRSGKVQGSSNQRSAEAAAAAMVEPAAWPVKADATTTTTDFKDFPSSLIWWCHRWNHHQRNEWWLGREEGRA